LIDMRIKKSFLHKLTNGFRLVMVGLVVVSFIGSSIPVQAATGLPDLTITAMTVTDMSNNPITEINAEQQFKVNVTVDNLLGDEYEDCTGPGEIAGDNCQIDKVYVDVYLGPAPLTNGCDQAASVYNNTLNVDPTDTDIILADDPAKTISVSVAVPSNQAGDLDLYAYVDVNCSVAETTVPFPDDYLEPEENNNSWGPIPFTVNSIGDCNPPVGGAQVFADVPVGHWARDYIEAMYYCGYTAGCSVSGPLLYCPDTIVNRAQSAVFLLRANFGTSYVYPAPPYNTFGDNFSPGPWAEPWVQGLFNAGMTAGCSSNPMLFCPWQETTRTELAIFGLRMKLGTSFAPPTGTGTVFADVPATAWYAGWAELAYSEGIILPCGTQGGKPLFCPDQKVSRAVASYTIAKAKNLLP
jgi:hypothetical protein